MWCYQKPGYEALLVAELQRQQQRSQFCDTLLKTEGVSVPAHSCILSAISPNISSALSSTPPPPAGQSRLLEFHALGTCTLLRLVRLLYCGEMTGEGEKEKQEAVTAAAKLGIQGLVEVTKRDLQSRNEGGEGQCAEVGVQTEPLMPGENEGRRGRWKREVRDGSTFLWRETTSEGERDTWTQTEELQVNSAPPSHPAASFETIDMSALQSFGTTQIVPPQIPYIPISLVYPPDENQMHQHPSALSDSLRESAAAGHTSAAAVAPPHAFAPPPLPFSIQGTLCAADPQSWWTDPQGATTDATAAERWEEEQLQQFEGNIPGYINYFLHPNKEERFHRGRARRRQGARVGGARRAGTGERRARRPRARTGGRGRGGLTQTVDVQEVGVSRLQKLFLQRFGLRASKTGQGGGAAGRKLYLKTRALMKPARRRGGRGNVWESSQSGDVPLYSEGGGSTQRRSARQQLKQDAPPAGRARRARAKPASVSFSSPHLGFHNAQTVSALGPILQSSPSPAASYAAPASSLLHSTPLPPPAPPPHEEQPEHFEQLLEEVMKGLDILPNSNNSNAPQPLPTSSSSCAHASCGNTLAQNKEQGHTAANSEVPVLQQQGEGELSEILDHFLQSFEQHVESTAREAAETGGRRSTEASQPHTVLRRKTDRKTKTRTTKRPQTCQLQHPQTPCPVKHSQTPELQPQANRQSSQPRKASARRAVTPKNTEGSPVKAKAPAKRRRRRNEYNFGLRMKKPKPLGVTNMKTVDDREDKQLQQIPVVKLERSSLLPDKAILRERSCLKIKIPAKTKCNSSTAPRDSVSKKAQQVSWSAKIYPIRSRFREAHIMDSMPFLEKQTPSKGPPGHRRRKCKQSGQLLSLSNNESSAAPVQLQPQEPTISDELERNQERHEGELSVQPQEQAERPTRRGEKRRAEEETNDKSTVTKRVCIEQTAQPTFETCSLSSETADFVSEPASRELNEVSSAGDCLQREQGEEESVRSEIKLKEEGLMDENMESSGDEIIDVDGPTVSRFVVANAFVSPSSHSEKEVGCESSWEEEDNIDVIGGSSPAPNPVIINWTESSEGEGEEGDEDVDVVGEKMEMESSAVVITVNKGELVNRKHQTEVLSH
ncbi:microtubule-associated protein futsch-like [Plectropomus leopardus]|uniref:microtubule-associated protein futsch-like n=1 Tax=Plectropomus leopardus TaxID=160734 RepID=UPI001C4BB45C|nr:microtubule-associated protein futsch-like [Plectropomus leopardus]